MKSLASLIVVILLLAGCVQNPFVRTEKPAATETRETPRAVPAQPPVPAPERGGADLRAGIASYEDGDYKQSARQLQSALSQGLESRSEARAHKYLAFMHCVGGRPVACRDEFRKALEADPGFDLSPGEAGHPTWGPVFRKIKAEARPVRR